MSRQFAVSESKPKKGKFKLTPYMFVLPAFILMVTFLLWPALMSLRYAFTNYNIMRPDQVEWVAFSNFIKLFSDGDFKKALGNTIYFTVVVVPYQCCLALALALLINRKARGVGIFRAAYFSPMVTSMTVISILWTILYNPNPNQGLINAIIVKLGFESISFLRDPNTAMNSIIFMSGWQAAGYQMMIFLAGLQNIPQDRYEAASIDGAGVFQRFWYITIPGLANVIKYVVIITMIQAMKLFTQPYIMTQGGPQNTTRTLVYYIYQQGFQFRNFGYACAISVIFFLIVVCMSFAMQKLLNSQGRG